jgi:hypothetical protein
MAEVVNVEDAYDTAEKQTRVLVQVHPHPGLPDGESVKDTSSVDAFVVFLRTGVWDTRFLKPFWDLAMTDLGWEEEIDFGLKRRLVDELSKDGHENLFEESFW